MYTGCLYSCVLKDVCDMINLCRKEIPKINFFKNLILYFKNSEMYHTESVLEIYVWIE